MRRLKKLLASVLSGSILAAAIFPQPAAAQSYVSGLRGFSRSGSRFAAAGLNPGAGAGTSPALSAQLSLSLGSASSKIAPVSPSPAAMAAKSSQNASAQEVSAQALSSLEAVPSALPWQTAAMEYEARATQSLAAETVGNSGGKEGGSVSSAASMVRGLRRMTKPWSAGLAAAFQGSAEFFDHAQKLGPDAEVSGGSERGSGGTPGLAAIDSKAGSSGQERWLAKTVAALGILMVATPAALAGDGGSPDLGAKLALGGALMAGLGLLLYLPRLLKLKVGPEEARSFLAFAARAGLLAAGAIAGGYLPMAAAGFFGAALAASGIILGRPSASAPLSSLGKTAAKAAVWAGAGLMAGALVAAGSPGLAAAAAGLLLILGLIPYGSRGPQGPQEPAVPRRAEPEKPTLLDGAIRSSLRYSVLTLILALGLLGYGIRTATRLPVDVLPDLDRPRVTVLVDVPGRATEEVETQVTIPLESVLNGATGVLSVRTQTGPGLAVLNADFPWGSDIYKNRQIVAEKLALAAESLPPDAHPQMAPVSSIMGQIGLYGLSSRDGATGAMELWTDAYWRLRPALQAVPGVSRVLVMGDRKQYQVLVDPQALLAHDVTLADVEQALRSANENASGGFLNVGPNELLVRSIGLIQDIQELERVAVKPGAGRSVLLGDVARVLEAPPPVKRGAAAVNGRPGVIMIVFKQPGADTRAVTAGIHRVFSENKNGFPADVSVETIFEQKAFVDRSLDNVYSALRDGAILVSLVLLLFLRNWRTTSVTLTALPLSVAATALVFRAFGFSINTMTLAGLGLALGEVVDDAIVDVENVFRRLRENRAAGSPLSPMRVVYEASREVRNSIVFSTALVVLAFVPLFALEGIEGRLFAPLGLAYVVSILASLAVSLTVTPALSYWLLKDAKSVRSWRENRVIRGLKAAGSSAIRFSLQRPRLVLSAALMGAALSAYTAADYLGRDFLAPFNEGSAQVNLLLPPGTSLAESDRIGRQVDERLKRVPGILAFGRRTGRADGDEHAEGVNVSEIIVTFDPASGKTRQQVLDQVREELSRVPGVVSSVEQPLKHMIDHMMSGVKANVAIPIYGDDLATLRGLAAQVQEALAGIEGIRDLQAEQQVDVPQLLVLPDRDRLVQTGVNPGAVNRLVHTALQGEVVSEIVQRQGQRRFDLLLRIDPERLKDPEQIRGLLLDIPGGRVPLGSVAEVREGRGPNLINRTGGRRRIVVQLNVSGRDLGSVMADVQARLSPIQQSMPQGYHLEYGGQFESQQEATRTLALLGALSLALMFAVLYSKLRSVNMTLQVLSSLPLAAIGGVAALVLTRQPLSVSAMVGFISLAGISTRNAIMLISHYLHLMKHEGEGATAQMMIRAGQERLVPMAMTAATAWLALLPILLEPGAPGREILYPVATVVFGGILSSFGLDLFVHPALFELFGREDARRLVSGGKDELSDEKL